MYGSQPCLCIKITWFFFFFNVMPHPYCRPFKLESLGHGMSIDIVYSSSDDFHGSRGWEPLFQINFRTVFQIPKNQTKVFGFDWDYIAFYKPFKGDFDILTVLWLSKLSYPVHTRFVFSWSLMLLRGIL